MNYAEALEAAAARIERVGWHHGTGRGPLGEVCVAIAIKDEVGLGEAVFACRAFQSHLGLPTDRATVLFDWNDDDHRTKEQVVKELRACAADLRAAQ